MATVSNSLPIEPGTLLTAPVAAASDRAAQQQLRSAVSTLNRLDTAGPGREFSISIDSKTKQPVVRIVDSATRELVEQIPSQYILDLAEELGIQSASNRTDNGR